MTGFIYYITKNKDKKKNIKNINLVKHNANQLSHRGSTAEHSYSNSDSYLRIFINEAQSDDVSNPIIQKNGNITHGISLLDGTIFNDRMLNNELLKEKQEGGKDGKKEKDIPSLNKLLYQCYLKWNNNLFNKIDGLYSILISNDAEIIAAKDPIGHNPLYIINSDDYLLFSSELKALKDFKEKPFILQPGTFFKYNKKNGIDTIQTFFPIDNLAKIEIKKMKDLSEIKKNIFRILEESVRKNINVSCKVSSLLSGGIDSTIICALAQKYIPDLEVYTVAAENSPDLEHAKEFIKKYPNVNHHIFDISIDDIKKILPDVIFHLETFDAALIRSALPMYHICSKINMKTGVLLTGEGADELFGGYQYLKNMSTRQLNEEFMELLKVEHATGLQRVDRIPYAFGFEARAPWFDLNLVKYAFSIPQEMKINKSNGIILEKWIMRETFRDIIPDSIYKRPKAKFSEGVGSQFFMRDFFNEIISDNDFEMKKEIQSGIYAKNKEELHYWNIFKKHFSPNPDFIKEIPRTAVFTI